MGTHNMLLLNLRKNIMLIHLLSGAMVVVALVRQFQ